MDINSFIDFPQHADYMNHFVPFYETPIFYLTNSNISLFVLLYITSLSFVVVSAGILLLAGIVGSISLTVQDYSNPKSQLIYTQVSRESFIYSYSSRSQLKV